MLTRLRARALYAFGYNSNDEMSDDELEMKTRLDDSKVTDGGWVFIRQKRPQRSCTKRNLQSETDEWFTVKTSARNRVDKTRSRSDNKLSMDYDTADDIDYLVEDKIPPEQQDKGSLFRESEGEPLEPVDTVLTRNQKRLMMAAQESKAILDRGMKTQRLQNSSPPSANVSRKQMRHENRTITRSENNKRGRKRHMMTNKYSGKSGQRCA